MESGGCEVSMDESYLNRVWLIESVKESGDKVWIGGLRLGSPPVVVTSSLDLHSRDLQGKSYHGCWRKLKILVRKERFNLALVGICGPDDSEVDLVDSFDPVLEVGDHLQVVAQADYVPFSSYFGRCSRPLPISDCVSLIHSTTKESLTKSDRLALFEGKHVPYLVLGNVITKGHTLHHLHPKLPLIQAHTSDSYDVGSYGCPVYTMGGHHLVGVFLFVKSSFAYIIPLRFVREFFHNGCTQEPTVSFLKLRK